MNKEDKHSLINNIESNVLKNNNNNNNNVLL